MALAYLRRSLSRISSSCWRAHWFSRPIPASWILLPRRSFSSAIFHRLFAPSLLTIRPIRLKCPMAASPGTFPANSSLLINSSVWSKKEHWDRTECLWYCERMRILRLSRPSQYAWAVIVAVSLFVLSPALAGGGDSTVVATVGSHKITEAELDAKIKPEMAALESKVYDLKHQALESMADEYLLEQAAKRDKLTVPDYLKKAIGDKTPQVSEADAHKYYDQRKGPGTPPFDQIKTRLIAALQNQSDQEQREKVLAALRKETPTKILITAPRVEVALKQVREKYGDKVRLVYMDFPLPMHGHALDAAKAGRCAAEQGKFWPYHDAMFADQSRQSPADLKATAKSLGLDTAKFDTCFDQAKYEAGVRADMEQGK